MERADQVLAAHVIDAGLAADRRIDLRQQRRRHLHEPDPAHEDRRGKPGHVAHDTSAQRDHEALAVGAALDQCVEYLSIRNSSSCGLRRRAAPPSGPRRVRRVHCAPFPRRGHATVALVTSAMRVGASGAMNSAARRRRSGPIRMSYERPARPTDTRCIATIVRGARCGRAQRPADSSACTSGCATSRSTSRFGFDAADWKRQVRDFGVQRFALRHQLLDAFTRIRRSAATGATCRDACGEGPRRP